MKERGISFLKGIRGSYCLVFFSNHSLFAVCLLIASFLDPCVGASGLICTIFTLILSNLFGLNPALIQNGTYSFNSLLTGLALGVYFKFSGNFLVMLLIASVVNLFITLFLASVTDKNKLPFLSLPFILTIWILLLNTRSFESSFLIPKEAGACATFWGTGFKDLSLVLENSFPGVVGTYFKSMALIFFQNGLVDLFPNCLYAFCYRIFNGDALHAFYTGKSE